MANSKASNEAKVREVKIEEGTAKIVDTKGTPVDTTPVKPKATETLPHGATVETF